MTSSKRCTDIEILKALVSLAIPVIIEQVLSTLLQYVDTAMVGHLGEQATASVCVTTTINWLVGSIPFAGGMAFMALISRSLGSGDKDKIKLLSRHAFAFAVLCGITVGSIALILSPFIPAWMGAEKDVQKPASMYFFVVSLPMIFRSAAIVLGSALRAVKDTRTPMLISVAENILNVILNYLFIYAIGWSVVGAALGSAISFTFAGILICIAFYKNKVLSGGSVPAVFNKGSKSFRHFLHFFTPDAAIVRETVRIGLPVLGTNIMSCLGYVVFAALVSNMGTYIFAAHSIAVTAEMLFYIPGFGFRTAASTLAGISLGKRDKDELASVERVSAFVTIATLSITGLILYCFAYPLMCIFTSSGRAALLGAEVLRIVAFSEPLYGLSVVFEGIYYGLGRSRFPFYVETFSMWVIRVLFTTICVHVFPLNLHAVWYCMISDIIFKAVFLSAPVFIPPLKEKLLGLGNSETAVQMDKI